MPFVRSVAQISESKREETTLDLSLRESKRLAQKIATHMATLRIGVDFSDTANLRIKEDKVVFYVRTAAQKAKLSQLLPRISDWIQKAGFFLEPEIKIRPTRLAVAAYTPTEGIPRKTSKEAAQVVRQNAEKITEGPVKRSLMKLAKTLES